MCIFCHATITACLNAVQYFILWLDSTSDIWAHIRCIELIFNQRHLKFIHV